MTMTVTPLVYTTDTKSVNSGYIHAKIREYFALGSTVIRCTE